MKKIKLNIYAVVFLCLITQLSLFARKNDENKNYQRTAQDTNTVISLFDRAGKLSASYPDSTRIIALQMMKLSKSIGYENGIGRAYFMTGLSFFVRSVDDSAMFWFQKSLELFQKTGDPAGLGLAYHNIGRLYGRRHETVRAKESILKALYYRKVVGEPEAIISTLTMLGLIAGYENNFVEEERYHLEVLSIAQKMNPPSIRGMAMAYNNLGDVTRKQKHYSESLKFYEQAIHYQELAQGLSGVADALIGRAELFLTLGKTREALTDGLRAFTISQKSEFQDGIVRASSVLSIAFEKNGDYKSALLYHKINSAAQDSLDKIQSQKEYAEALTKYETKQKEAEIKILSQENALNVAEKNQKSLERNILIGFIIMFLIAIAAAYIRSKEIRKIETAMREQKIHEDFSRQLLTQQEQERKRITSELHDSLGQNLLIIKNMLDINAQSQQSNQQLVVQLQELSEIAARSIEETRTIASNLHPYQLSRMGLSKAVAALFRNLEQSTKLVLTSSIGEITQPLGKEHEVHLYRMVQESVNNILKHAQATELTFALAQKEHELEITIGDNGIGFDLQKVEHKDTSIGGLGLLGIRERARILNGKVVINSYIGKGTTIKIVVPKT